MAKKLVKILAEELSEWPEGASYAMQSRSTNEVYFYWENLGEDSFVFELSIKASDFIDADVTRAQWEAERARIAEDLQMTKHKAGADELERRHAKSVGAEDWALWDKVAVLRYSANLDDLQKTGFYGVDDSRPGAAQIAFSEADAFMAERAKRMKG